MGMGKIKTDRQLQTDGSLPDQELVDIFADALVDFIMALEQEEKEKSA